MTLLTRCVPVSSSLDGVSGADALRPCDAKGSDALLDIQGCAVERIRPNSISESSEDDEGEGEGILLFLLLRGADVASASGVD